MYRSIRFSVAAALAAGLALFALGCAGSQESATTSDATDHATATTPAVDAAQAVVTDENGTRVTLEVTGDGFVPASVTVPAGKPVTLAVTRHTDRTCATSLVMKAENIDLALPLDETVEVTFTPQGPGTLDYACPMDMIKGQIVVE